MPMANFPFIGWIIFFTTWIGGCAVVSHAPFVLTIEQIKPSVFPIVCAGNVQGKTTVISFEGTGFFVGADETFITADHVLTQTMRPDRKTPCPSVGLYIPDLGWQNDKFQFNAILFTFKIEQCVRDERSDLAACKPEAEIKPRIGRNVVPIILETSLQPDGTPIAFTGFPLSSILPLTAIGVISGYLSVEEQRGPREIYIDKAGWPGASGSPMYLANGNVVGIFLQRGINTGIGRSVGRPSGFIQDLLIRKEEKKPSQK